MRKSPTSTSKTHIPLTQAHFADTFVFKFCLAIAAFLIFTIGSMFSVIMSETSELTWVENSAISQTEFEQKLTTIKQTSTSSAEKNERMTQLLDQVGTELSQDNWMPYYLKDVDHPWVRAGMLVISGAIAVSFYYLVKECLKKYIK